MIRAAGIFFLTSDKQALFLKRSSACDHPGEWSWPGGKLEEEETPIEAAIRETFEEAGIRVEEKDLTLHTHSVTPADALAGEDVSFTTFLCKIPSPFIPTLCEENSGWSWASIAAPPLPIHPSCQLSIARLDMDELGVAQAMAFGQLSSPQVYKNVFLWNIRITGTGVAYRRSIDEYVLRQPEHYLTDEFIARCNGLSVIAYHPQKATLNSEEFAKRVVGSVFYPYLKPDEVWAIAKVYDDDMNEELIKNPASTSPAVILGRDNNLKIEAEDGKKILIEGKPELLDHIALLPNSTLGVWDKGEGPVGVDRSGVAIADSFEEINFISNKISQIQMAVLESSLKLNTLI